MKFSLSTNWCNQRMESGEEIADKALELGFDGLELGFHTTQFQVEGFKRRLDQIPVGSVHAFCPVPISAPQGYPELYQLASFDAEARKMAQIMIKRNIAFAADMGATALVLHAGRVMCDSWFASWRQARRVKRGLKMIDILKKELEQLAPELEKRNVKLGLENLPYLEGFPNLSEVTSVTGDWVRPWFDTGHWFALQKTSQLPNFSTTQPLLGMHLNDSKGGDDHLAPGDGNMDFNDFKPMMEVASEHLVLEPNSSVPEANLRHALSLLRSL